MKRKMEAILTAVPLLVLASAAASAGEPLQLNGQQMDKVTAAGSAMANALSDAVGLFAMTETKSFAGVEVLKTANFQATSIQLIGSLSKAASLADTTAPVNGNGNDNANANGG
jgi:hypothetical protein